MFISGGYPEGRLSSSKTTETDAVHSHDSQADRIRWVNCSKERDSHADEAGHFLRYVEIRWRPVELLLQAASRVWSRRVGHVFPYQGLSLYSHAHNADHGTAMSTASL